MRLQLTRPVAVDDSEAVRYLRSPGGAVPEEDLQSAARRVLEAAQPAAAAAVFPLALQGGCLLLGALELPGAAISRHLSGCDRCAVLGVTLGFGVDRLISAAGYSDPYRALLYDACATAAIEDLADHATERIRAQLLGGRGSLTPRFSPGYGDLPLTLQHSLLDLIDARRSIGLTAGSSFLLSPVKSVTALIGVSDRESDRDRRTGCAVCVMGGGCSYRKAPPPPA